MHVSMYFESLWEGNAVNTGVPCLKVPMHRKLRLERLLNELEFDQELAKTPIVCGLFEVVQFRRAIADGTFTWLSDVLKAAVQAAYVAITNANWKIEGMTHAARPAHSVEGARQAIDQARPVIDAAVTVLRETL